MNAAVIAVICILVFGLLRGYYKGFVGALGNVIAIVLGVGGIAILMYLLDSALTKEFGEAVIAALFFLLFILLVQVVKLVLGTISVLSKLPIVHWLDKTLGTLIGVVEGFALVWALLIFLKRYGLHGYSDKILNMLQENSFTSFLCRYNVVEYLWHYFLNK